MVGRVSNALTQPKRGIYSPLGSLMPSRPLNSCNVLLPDITRYASLVAKALLEHFKAYALPF